MDAKSFVAKPVDETTWPDLERLFEGRGGPSYCWCMAWREMENRSQATKAERKRALHKRVRAGVPIGLVGYADGEPVAWCSVAPRETFRKLRDDQDAAEKDVWSVVCFFVRRDHRKSGLSARMLEAAAAFARTCGGKVLESYPVDPDSPSYRFMGFGALYEPRGFEVVGKAGSRRHVMRRKL